VFQIIEEFNYECMNDNYNLLRNVKISGMREKHRLNIISKKIFISLSEFPDILYSELLHFLISSIIMAIKFSKKHRAPKILTIIIPDFDSSLYDLDSNTLFYILLIAINEVYKYISSIEFTQRIKIIYLSKHYEFWSQDNRLENYKVLHKQNNLDLINEIISNSKYFFIDKKFKEYLSDLLFKMYILYTNESSELESLTYTDRNEFFETIIELYHYHKYKLISYIMNNRKYLNDNFSFEKLEYIIAEIKLKDVIESYNSFLAYYINMHFKKSNDGSREFYNLLDTKYKGTKQFNIFDAIDIYMEQNKLFLEGGAIFDTTDDLKNYYQNISIPIPIPIEYTKYINKMNNIKDNTEEGINYEEKDISSAIDVLDNFKLIEDYYLKIINNLITEEAKKAIAAAEEEAKKAKKAEEAKEDAIAAAEEKIKKHKRYRTQLNKREIKPHKAIKHVQTYHKFNLK